MAEVILRTGDVETVPVDPVPDRTPVDPEVYTRTTCPLCFGELQERRSGLWCPRDRGWLVEETRGDRLVYVLWQGRP